MLPNDLRMLTATIIPHPPLLHVTLMLPLAPLGLISWAPERPEHVVGVQAQDLPSPVQPELQAHVKPPAVFVQAALVWQSLRLLLLHSLTSEQVVPVPV
jgi:hypothetical protein